MKYLLALLLVLVTVTDGFCQVVGYPSGSPPQMGGFSGTNIPEAETLTGDATLWRIGPNSYTITVNTLKGGVPIGLLSGLGVGTGLTATGGNLNLALSGGACTSPQFVQSITAGGIATCGTPTTGGGGSVTSVGLSGGTTGLTVSGSPVTSSGTMTLAGTLAVANGGTGAITAGAALTSLGAAPLASPTFTGTVTIPSGASIAGFAPLASPTFTGTVTAPILNVSSTFTIAGNPLGGTCGGGQFVNFISSSGVPTCSTPAGGSGYPAGTAPQIGGYTAGGASEAETLSGDATLTRAGVNSYTIAVTKTGGVAFGALATLGVGTGLVSGGGNLSLSTPVSVANGGLGAGTTPAVGQIEVAASTTAFAPVTVSGDATLTSAGVLTVTKTGGTAFSALATASVPLSIANGGRGSGTAPTAGQIDVAQSGTAFGAVTMSGDATITSLGAVTVSKIAGVTPGGTCTNPQFVQTISSSGVPTCATPSTAGGAYPAGAPPQIGGFSATNTAEAETVTGDFTFTRAGANSYTAAVTKLNGTAVGALATLGVGTGLTSSGGNLNLTVPVAVANGGTGSVTAPTIGQVEIASSTSAFTPVTMSGDATITSAGAITVTKTNGTALTGLATASIPLSIANGGTGSSTAPTTGQFEVAQSASAYGPVTMSGDATITSTGAITVTKLNGTTPGGTCTNPQFVQVISASGVPTCAIPSAGASHTITESSGTATMVVSSSTAATIDTDYVALNAAATIITPANTAMADTQEVYLIASTSGTAYTVGFTAGTGTTLGTLVLGDGSPFAVPAACGTVPTTGYAWYKWKYSTSNTKLTLIACGINPPPAVIATALGGTGLTSPTAHSLMLAEGSSAFSLITAATAGNIIVDQGSGADFLSKTVSGDATLASSGAITVTKLNGTTPGGTCTGGQFVNVISASGVPTCGTPAGSVPPGAPPQLVGYSATNTEEAETVTGDFTLTRAGANSYTAAVTKLGGTTVGALATLNVGVGLVSSGGNLNLTVPVTAANGGSGTASPTAHSLLMGEGSSAFGLITATTGGGIIVDQGIGVDFAEKSVSGDATLSPSGVITVTKTNGTSLGALATLGVGTGLTSSSGNLNLTTPVTVANGGTGAGTLTAHGVLLGEGTSAVSNVAVCATGTVLYGQAAADPICSTTTWPNAATQGDLLVATGANAVGRLTAVAAGSVLTSAGTGTIPAYSSTPTFGVPGSTVGTLTLANGGAVASWTLTGNGVTTGWTLTPKPTVPAQGDIFIFSTSAGQMSTVPDVATGSVLTSQGANTVPAYSSAPGISGVNFVSTTIPTAALATTQGNGSKVQLSTGATTTNDCVKFDANGNTVDNGAACGVGGGATISPYMTMMVASTAMANFGGL